MTIDEAIATLTRECQRCGHKWLLRRNVKPTVCPKCKSAYWDTKKEATG